MYIALLQAGGGHCVAPSRQGGAGEVGDSAEDAV